MKMFKRNKGYGAFEYTVVIVLALIVLSKVKTNANTSNSLLDAAILKAQGMAGVEGGGVGGGTTTDIQIAFSGSFDYDYELELEDAINSYFATATVTDKDGNVRTDYTLENIAKVGGFAQVDVNIDIGELKRVQFAVNDVCYLAQDSDFLGEYDGTFIYIGTNKCVEIPHTIKGVNVTSYLEMFAYTDVKKVISTNINVTDMSGMFYGSQATSLDLSNFNTSNVIDMRGMFSDSQLKSLNVLSFNTSNVTNMYLMFAFSKITSLDLSSFDISGAITTDYMFSDSINETVFVKDAATKTKFDAILDNPPTLTIIIK